MKKDPALTQWLQLWRGGSDHAWVNVVECVYPNLRRLAAKQIAQTKPGPQADHYLNATALVHEAFFKLVDQQGVDWQNRDHFYAICARLIRRVLIDALREQHAEKRGGTQDHVPFYDGDFLKHNSTDVSFLVQDALTQLAADDPLAARVAELRYIVGLTTAETADVLGVGVATVGRHWRFARAWLQTTLQRGTVGASG